MLDCPEHSQTSPTTTLVNATVFRPTTVSVSGPPCSIASSRTIHFPSASAVAVACRPANETDTASPGAALPHTGTAICRCRTMLLEKMRGSVTSAEHVYAAAMPASARVRHDALDFTFMSSGPFGFTPCAGKPARIRNEDYTRVTPRAEARRNCPLIHSPSGSRRSSTKPMAS